MKNLSSLQHRAIIEAYTHLYALVGASKEDHFVLTSSGAEGVNQAIFSAYLEITRKTGKNHFLCLQTDEAPTLIGMSRLQELGCVFQTIPVDAHGRVSQQAVAEMLSPRTAMLSLSLANGLTGVIQPVQEIATLCKERDVFFHVEVTHMLGKGELKLEEIGADVLTFDGPTPGVGGLYLRQGVELAPLIMGGNEQGQLRAGSLNVEALLGLARYAQDALRYADHYCMEVARLKALFEELILQALPTARVLFQDQERVPHITSVLFPGIVSEMLLYKLSQKGCKATFGGNTFQYLTHILKACGIEEPACHSGLSFSFSHKTTEGEVESQAALVIEAVQSLTKYSQHLMEQLT
ncbi:MAG: Cysteine desulfurase IscS [Chlamydiales bacterium]|nr:Cysteine desulfurase IscS [Chlamydiales bacterium]